MKTNTINIETNFSHKSLPNPDLLEQIKALISKHYHDNIANIELILSYDYDSDYKINYVDQADEGKWIKQWQLIINDQLNKQVIGINHSDLSILLNNLEQYLNQLKIIQNPNLNYLQWDEDRHYLIFDQFDDNENKRPHSYPDLYHLEQSITNYNQEQLTNLSTYLTSISSRYVEIPQYNYQSQPIYQNIDQYYDDEKCQVVINFNQNQNPIVKSEVVDQDPFDYYMYNDNDEELEPSIESFDFDDCVNSIETLNKINNWNPQSLNFNPTNQDLLKIIPHIGNGSFFNILKNNPARIDYFHNLIEVVNDPRLQIDYLTYRNDSDRFCYYDDESSCIYYDHKSIVLDTQDQYQAIANFFKLKDYGLKSYFYDENNNYIKINTKNPDYGYQINDQLSINYEINPETLAHLDQDEIKNISHHLKELKSLMIDKGWMEHLDLDAIDRAAAQYYGQSFYYEDLGDDKANLQVIIKDNQHWLKFKPFKDFKKPDAIAPLIDFVNLNSKQAQVLIDLIKDWKVIEKKSTKKITPKFQASI